MEIRVDLGFGVVRLITKRSLGYDANVHVFIFWMLGASVALIAVAILFLRNQIRPILRLAKAAEDFGKGRYHEFQPRGAREVRQAGYAFVEMKRRIERANEQRTAMLSGVSHDLRTILTRFRLSLAMLEANAEMSDLENDVEEMQAMLEGYLAFARGDGGEAATLTDLAVVIEEMRREAERHGAPVFFLAKGDLRVTVRPMAIKRCLGNLVGNAQRLRATRRNLRASARVVSSWFTSTTTGPACRRRRATKCSVRSSGSTKRATRTRAAPASGCPSPATSRAPTAARSCSATARSAACGRACACRCEERPMPSLQTKTLAAAPDAYAPDGSEVRLLAALDGGSFAHFTLPAGKVSAPVAHRTVEEIWYVVAGAGELWRRYGDGESVTALQAGVSLTIPLGAHFQFRAAGKAALSFVAVTMPPWPGAEEAYSVPGRWAPS